ncbi:MAG: hypothetical protein JST83_09100 [Bacteroidetes bacterium]|nr:hypothetical protein [Bacteroidota bacterium]
MEIREEIKHIVDTLPENILLDVLKHMEKIKEASSDANNLEKYMDQILSEDDNLLKRLAQ